MAQQPIKGNQIDQSSLNIDSILPSQTGNNGKVLGTDGTNASWVTAGGGGGTVTSVDVSGGTTGLTFTGGPVTTTGTITAGGTLDEVNGGTGQTSYTTGDILYASASNTLSKLSAGSDGQVLTLASGVPSWAAGGGGGGGDSYTLQPVRVATTANITLSNTQTIDGVSVVAGDRVLVKNQSTASQNGIYLCVSGGAWTRATDFTTGAATLTGGALVPVIAGTRNGGSVWQCMVTTAITIGSTNIPFYRASSGSTNQNQIMIGNNANFTSGTVGVAIGGTVASNSSIAVLGTATGASNAGAVAIGESSAANAQAAIAIGQGASATGSGSIVIGSASASTNAPNTSSTYAIVIGSNSSSGVQTRVTGNNGIAIGNRAQASDNAVRIGFSGADSSTGFGSVAIGPSTYATGNGSTSVGYGNSTQGWSNTVAIGTQAFCDFDGQMLISNGRFSANSDIGTGFFTSYIQTTDATTTELKIRASIYETSPPTGVIRLSGDSSYIFDCDIIARNTATDDQSKAWNLKFAIRRGSSAANTALIGSATKTVIGEDTNATTWDVSVTADTTNGRPNISVTGEASKTIRWVANIRMTKVSG